MDNLIKGKKVQKTNWTSAAGITGKVVSAKIETGTDLISAIFEIAKEHKIASGSVTAIGSLKAATVEWANSMDVNKSMQETMISCNMSGPLELSMGWGIFGTADSANMHIHFHALIMDKDGTLKCGNLKKDSAPVLATVDLVLEEFQNFEVKPTFHPIRKNYRLLPKLKES